MAAYPAPKRPTAAAAPPSARSAPSAYRPSPMAQPKSLKRKREDGRELKGKYEYEVVGKVGEGTFGLVSMGKLKSNPKHLVAIKQFKPGRDGEGIVVPTLREIALLREVDHVNVIKLLDVSLEKGAVSLVFDYAAFDLQLIIQSHGGRNQSMPRLPNLPELNVKSIIWQVLNGLHYMHENWMMHRDIKPANILVMGEGPETGYVKIGDFGLARIYNSPVMPLADNGVVVTIWYRAPELLLGSKHYTPAVDVWAVGCMLYELVAMQTLFPAREIEATKEIRAPFQKEQVKLIFTTLGTPTESKWPLFKDHEFYRKVVEQQWKEGESQLAGRLRSIDHSHLKSDQWQSLLRDMLEYDPDRRTTAGRALQHPWFQQHPLPQMNSLEGIITQYRPRTVNTEPEPNPAKRPAR